MLSLMLALHFLIPQDIKQAGNVYILYPSNQQYVYTDSPAFVPTDQPVRDGNEEDAYFRKMKHKEIKPVVTLPLEQIIQPLQAEKKEIPSAPPKAKEQSEHMAAKISFDSGRSFIKGPERKRLVDIMPLLRQADGIEVKGYTDKTGSRKYNDTLALRRAAAVRRFLISQGIEEETIRVTGEGSCCYISDKNSENRRVEIWVKADH